MSFNPNDMISLSNYEEYFILYMDNELDAAQKLMVENFVAQHPHLEEELDVLMSTKLPLDNLCFERKEDLLSHAMKMDAAEESLLLYIDDELPAAGSKDIEKRIAVDKEFALQHSLLMQTKLDASEAISYPNKKELYRHERKVVPFGFWVRIAAAIVVLLFSSLFYLLNNSKPANKIDDPSFANLPAKTTTPVLKESPKTTEEVQKPLQPKEEVALVKTPLDMISKKQEKQNIDTKEGRQQKNEPAINKDIALNRKETIHFDASRFTNDPNLTALKPLNNPDTYSAVTSALSVRKTDEGTTEPAVTDGDFKDTKKTPARGFFRKVSRFIERKTGIGTANADDELLIGAVALKLK